jgi:hypothetical protein
MESVEAIWYPIWHECDSPIHAGQVAEFDFFTTPPPYLLSGGKPVLFHLGWHEKEPNPLERKRLRILSLCHPQLGSIQSIETNDLDYTLTMSDNRIFVVNAEEKPGLIDDGEIQVEDWRIYVEAEAL